MPQNSEAIMCGVNGLMCRVARPKCYFLWTQLSSCHRLKRIVCDIPFCTWDDGTICLQAHLTGIYDAETFLVIRILFVVMHLLVCSFSYKLWGTTQRINRQTNVSYICQKTVKVFWQQLHHWWVVVMLSAINSLFLRCDDMYIPTFLFRVWGVS